MIREILPPNTAEAFRAMQALRTHLRDPEEFVRRVDEVQRPAGYRLVGAFGDGFDALAVAGFRIGENLAWGRFLYVDDLSTLPEARRRGYARALLDWLLEEGQRQDCAQFHLDSGVGPARADAHRLYLNAGLLIASHHFARSLDRD